MSTDLPMPCLGGRANSGAIASRTVKDPNATRNDLWKNTKVANSHARANKKDISRVTRAGVALKNPSVSAYLVDCVRVS